MQKPQTITQVGLQHTPEPALLNSTLRYTFQHPPQRAPPYVSIHFNNTEQLKTMVFECLVLGKTVVRTLDGRKSGITLRVKEATRVPLDSSPQHSCETLTSGGLKVQ